MDVSELLKQLGVLAEKSPEARAFILALMLQLVFLAGFMMLGVRGAVRWVRSRSSDGESDEDVTPKDNTISVLTQILAKTADNGARLVERIDQIEAVNAGVTAKLETVIQVDKQFLAALNSLTVASEQLLKVAGGIRTREEAAAQNAETLAVVKAEVAPVLATTAKVLDQTTAQGAAIGTIDTKADLLLSKVDALPPHLDALRLKMDELPTIVKESFAVLIAERDTARGDLKAATEQLAQTAAARDMFRVQVETLTERLRVAESTIAALPKPPVVSADTSVPPVSASGGDVPPAPEGVVA